MPAFTNHPVRMRSNRVGDRQCRARQQQERREGRRVDDPGTSPATGELTAPGFRIECGVAKRDTASTRSVALSGGHTDPGVHIQRRGTDDVLRPGPESSKPQRRDQSAMKADSRVIRRRARRERARQLRAQDAADAHRAHLSGIPLGDSGASDRKGPPSTLPPTRSHAGRRAGDCRDGTAEIARRPAPLFMAR